MYGDSLSGKTTWARSLGNHVWFQRLISGKVALAEMANADYAVFDDVSLKNFVNWQGWLGCQAYVQLRQLHRDPVYERWGKVGIWCTNKDPRVVMHHSIAKDDGNFDETDVAWLEANCNFIHVSIDNPLVTFRASTE